MRAPLPMFKAPEVWPEPIFIVPVCPEPPPSVKFPLVRFAPIVMFVEIPLESSTGVDSLVVAVIFVPLSVVVVLPVVPIVIGIVPVAKVPMFIPPPFEPVVREPVPRFRTPVVCPAPIVIFFVEIVENSVTSLPVALTASKAFAFIVPIPLMFVIPADEPMAKVFVDAIEVPKFKFPVCVDNKSKSTAGVGVSISVA